MAARFLFLVHALSPAHRRFIGLRRADPAITLGLRDGTDPYRAIGRICRLRLGAVAEGEVWGVPLDPAQMLEDQERALVRLERAARLAMLEGPVGAIGLGSLAAVVGGRGEALQERLAVPVTTGAAATTWALWKNTVRVLERRPDATAAIIGAAGPVGRAVAELLAADGYRVRVDNKRAANGLDVEAADGPAAAARGCAVVVGAATTGGLLPPEALASGAVVVDVALPSILTGPPPAGVRMLAGEAVSCPPSWDPGLWGPIYQVLAGYGPQQVYACLIEPLVLAVEGRAAPYALGRKLEAGTVRQFAAQAEALGFQPRLAAGWWAAQI
jgi:putrescine aminotransferase